ncbi:MAG: S-layer homology domain-containing protein, partial [Clostridia bacterium]|nr:S-layer homology domain-containing protein [Clostridia bacterium]
QSSEARWNDWLQGTWESADTIPSGVLKSTAHSYFYNGKGNKHRMAEAIKGNPENTYQVVSYDVNGNTSDRATLVSVRGLGATMYSVGFCLAEDKQITYESMEYVLKGIASSEDKAVFCHSAAELVDAFDVIAHALKYAATTAYFDDTMGADFDLQLATVHYPKDNPDKTITPTIEVSLYDLYTANEVGTSVGGKTVTQEMVGTRKPGAPSVLETVTFNAAGTEAYSSAFGDKNILKNGVICAKSFFYNTTAEAVQIDTNGDSNTDYALPAETFYWNIGTIRRQEVVLSYYVYLTGSMEGDAVEGTYPTNKSATLYYSNWLEHGSRKVTVSPVLPWGGATVSYGFYLVDGNGVPVTNETTGVTGSFADAVKLTSPVVAGYINLNSAGGVDAINVIASANLPEGYSLFDSTAAYSLTVSSSGNGSWSISGTNPKNTTYVANFKAGEAATTQRTANDPSYDYANTTVWFAVKYEIKCIPDAVVIDYGLPVDIDVLANDMFGANGKLEAIGAMGTVAESSLNSTTSAEKLPNGFISSGDLTLAHGKASMNGTKVRYTPTDMVMANEEHFVYAASYANARYHFGTVTVIPATSIYYEDSFVTFSGSWETVGTAENKTQAEDRPGAFSLGEFDANNVYGYDGAYSSYTTYSLGAAQKTTVSSGTNANPPTATFTFTGTAFDVVSMTNNKTGTIFVDVYAGSSASGTAIKNWVVDTYYGYSRTQDATNPYLKRTWTYGSDQAWHVVTEEVKQLPENAATTLPAQPDPSKTYVIYEPNYTWTPTGGDAIYQVPVLKSPTLDYGTYTVVIKPLYADMFNHAGGSSYDFYFDAVRVYDPAGKPESGVIHDAYAADGELNPGYVEIRDLLIGADTFNAATEGAQVNGVVFIDGANANGGGSTPSVSDYQSYGPKNEVYLAANQAIAFRMTSSIRNPNVQIGAKVAGGSSAKMTVSSQRSDQDATSSKGVSLTLKTATEMYYSLSSLGVIWTEQNGKYVSSPIIISNTGSSGIVSLTNIKAPGASINSITPVTLSAFDMVMDALIPTAYAADDSGYDLQIYCTGVLADQAIEVLEDAMLSAYERQRRIRYDKPVLHSTLITPTEDLWQNPYIDIASGAWYYDFVKSATEKGLMQGSGNRFDPNGNLTRAMLVTVLYRMSGESAQAAELPFEDVDTASWYAAAAAWAFEKGIIKGISETEFAPMQDVSRQDMAAMIARYAEAYGLKLQPADGTKFTDDASISDYAKDAVYGMKASGILSGRPSGAFDPKGTTNRAEAAKVLSLLAEMK